MQYQGATCTMSRRRSRSGRTVDKWSLKEFYTIITPDNFQIGKVSEGAPIGETIASSPELLIGRILEVPLSDLVGSYSLAHIKINFQISEVVGNNAKTKFKGHLMNLDYIKSIVKRRRTRVDAIQKVITQDNIAVRLTTTAITTHRCKNSQKHAIRLKMMEIMQESANSMPLNEFGPYILSKEINQQLYRACSKLFPLSNIVVQKSVVLKK